MTDKDIEAKFKELNDKLGRLYIAVGNLISSNRETAKVIDGNFQLLNKRTKTIEKKVNTLINRTNKEFGSVGKKLDNLQLDLDKLQKVTGYTDHIDNLSIVHKGTPKKPKKKA